MRLLFSEELTLTTRLTFLAFPSTSIADVKDVISAGNFVVVLVVVFAVVTAEIVLSIVTVAVETVVFVATLTTAIEGVVFIEFIKSVKVALISSTAAIEQKQPYLSKYNKQNRSIKN